MSPDVETEDLDGKQVTLTFGPGTDQEVGVAECPNCQGDIPQSEDGNHVCSSCGSEYQEI